jgi:predicted component of type VI protein secretion system
MPKLILQFEDRVLREYGVGASVTIGRLPDNIVVIDNPTVSSHHARLFKDGDRFVIEDLASTNGTYVNERLVARHTLHDGDVVLVGKHKLRFDEQGTAVAEEALPALSGLQDTIYLDTEKHRALLAKLNQPRGPTESRVAPPPVVRAAAANAGRVGVLRVLAGQAERTEYDLSARTSLIGKSEEALVRLHGWFQPKVAVAIARNSDGYVATVMGGKTLINSRHWSGRHHLKDGDTLEVSGLLMVFALKPAETSPRTSPA